MYWGLLILILLTRIGYKVPNGKVVVNAIRHGVRGIDHGSLVVLFQNLFEESK